MITAGQHVQERHLFVSWRDPEVGSIHPIGRLVRRTTEDGESYSFAYLKNAERLERFEPLPGLPDLHQRYDSHVLFPVFANRVMPRSRPDYDLLASRADLTGDADPFEVLARSGGRRATDRIEVFAGPERTATGESKLLFLSVVSVTSPELLKQSPLSRRATAWSSSTTTAMRTTPGPCYSVSVTASRWVGFPTTWSSTSTSSANSTVRIPS